MGTHPWEILATWTLGMLYSLLVTSDSTVHQSPSLQRERRRTPSEGPRHKICSGIYKDRPGWIPPEFPTFPCPSSSGTSWAIDGIIQPHPHPRFSSQVCQAVPPLGPRGSSAPEAMLFSSGGRGPFSPSAPSGSRVKHQSTLPGAAGRTYSEMMVSGSPSLNDSSSCTPSGKLARATAVALLSSGQRDRNGYPLGQPSLQIWGLVESGFPPLTLLQVPRTAPNMSSHTHVLTPHRSSSEPRLLF